MASKEVLTALETLHREIEKLEPAIKHVETAHQVTQMLKVIPQKYGELLEELQKSDNKFKDALSKKFSEELSMISDESGKIQSSTIAIQKVIQSQQNAIDKLIKGISDTHKEFSEVNIPGKIKEILDFASANNGFLDHIQNTMSENMDSLVKNLEKMHVANIESLQKIYDFQNQHHLAIKDEINKSNKLLETFSSRILNSQRLNSYITWILIATGVIIFFIIKN